MTTSNDQPLAAAAGMSAAPDTGALDSFAALVHARRTNLHVDPDRAVPDALLERLCELARWAPNHKRTWPWCFSAFTGDGRRRLGAAFVDDLRACAGGVVDDRLQAKIDKTAVKYLRAPTMLVCGARRDERASVDRENGYSVAAGLQHVLLGATAVGLASFWSSPPVTPSPNALACCGFEPDTTIVGVVYLGWPVSDAPVPPRPEITVHHIDS